MILDPVEAAEHVGEFVRNAATEMDARILLAALLGHAGALSRSLIQTGVLTPVQICQYFDGGRAGALDPPVGKSRVTYVDGEHKGSKQ